MPDRLASYRLGSEAISGTFTRAAPSAVVTGPAATVATTTTTVTWTYSSPVSRGQDGYRVRLESADGAVTFYDTGTLLGTGSVLSLAVSYLLNDQSTYRAVVNVSDGYDWSADAYLSFNVALPDVGSYPDADVGSKYEVGINGVGYMLADQPGTDFAYGYQAVPLDSPRFATGDTPFSEAVDRYTFVGWSDWREGAGQKYRNRADSSTSSFYDSEGIDPFTSPSLKLLNSTASTLSTSYATPLTVVAGNQLYVQTNVKTLTNVATIGGTTTGFGIAAATTIVALASDGTNWYAADGANIFKGSTAGDPGAAWSTIDATVMAYAADRLCVAYATSPSTTPNTFSTLKLDGTEDVAGGRYIGVAGSTITSIVGGNGYIWFAVQRGQQGLVYAYKAGSTDAPFVAFEFPVGQFPMALGFYLSNVFIRCAEAKSGGGATASIYRAATSDGKLVPTLVTKIDSGTDDHTVGSWAGNSTLALFSWKKLTAAGASGVGAIDLATGGWARWVYAPSSSVSGDVVSVVSWNGRIVFSVAGSGVYAEGTTPLLTGNLRTDVADLGTSLAKVFGEVKLETVPLPNGGSVVIEYTLDDRASYGASPFTLTGSGLQTLSGNIDKQSSSIGLRLTLNAAAGVSPEVRTVNVRTHPYGLEDEILTLPINCADNLSLLNGSRDPDSGPRRGARRARTLRSLMQTRVKVQDIDWDVENPSSSIWEVQSVKVTASGAVFDPHVNRQSMDLVAVLTLRRTLK